MADFNEILHREGYDCAKWDGYKRIWGRDDLLPMWVADMDFRTPSFVKEEIDRFAESGVYGYTFRDERWYNAICGWYERRHSFKVTKEELIFIPGIVRGIAFAELCFTEPGDKIMVLSPVYHPFFLVSERNKRDVVYSPLLINKETRTFDIDFDRMAEDIKGCKMLVFCNPHNPGGRVWSKEELRKVAEIAYDNNCLVVSDEIHCDLTLPGYSHIPFASVSEKAASNSIMFGAPSKAFNMPGIVSSYAVVKNPELWKKFNDFLTASEFNEGNMFAYNSCAACYEKGEGWLNEMLEYINGNIDFLDEYLKKNIPGIGMLRPQASYLVYLDCRGLGLEQEDLVKLFVEKAHLALNDGSMFGPGGKGFMRLNVGCPRSVLHKALEQLKAAI